jgi:hypothetical protein
MNEELIPIEPVQQIEKEQFNPSPELKLAAEKAIKEFEGRSFLGRNPHLGKMVNCQFCGLRHHLNERKCEQVFTYRIGDYELFRENENGELVPDYRTALRPDEKPTKRQVAGAAAFAKKRIHPHPSKNQLQLIERVRKIFLGLGFSLDDEGETFQKNLQRARVLALGQLRQERREARKARAARSDRSRRINRGLLAH